VEHPDEAGGGDAVTERLRKPARDSASGFGHDFIIACGLNWATKQLIREATLVKNIGTDADVAT
jgi:hypothetical protein